MDVFKGWTDYTERLHIYWNRLVGQEDTVIVPGDISWAMNYNEAAQDFEFIDDLNGRKILMKGNHDFWWSTMKKNNDFVTSNSFSSIDFLFNNSYLVDGNTAVAGTRGWMFGEDEEKVYARELGRLKTSLDSAGKLDNVEEIICFLHYPPIYEDNVCNDFVGLMKQYDVKRCYYGHLHGPSIPYSFNGEYDGIEFRLISSDKLLFQPLKIK